MIYLSLCIIKINDMKRLIQLTVLSGLLLVTGTLQAAAPQNTFIYRVKVTNVNDKSTFEAVSSEISPLFDGRILFNDTTDEIIIHSDNNISQEKLTERLNVAGYLLKSYRQATIPLRNY